MRVSINHSPLKDIRLLRGVGAVLASRITETRHERPFLDLQDLVHRVKGISNQTTQSWNQQTNIVVTFTPIESDDVSDSFMCSTLAATAVGAVLSFIIILSAVTFNDFDFTSNPSPQSPEQNGPKRNHTIYFECIENRDCAFGQECYPGKLHPREGPFNLYKMTEEELNQGGIWTQSKWGFEQVVQGSPLIRGIRQWASESGRRCWNISNQTGADCGDEHLQICDEEANLTCVYGKCRITNDATLLNHDYTGRNIKGSRFNSVEDAGCESEESLGWCLIREVLADLMMPSTEEDEYLMESLKRRNARIRSNRLFADTNPTKPINRIFPFPRVFGMQIQMDNPLISHFGSREAAEVAYREAVQNVSNVFRANFGFTLRIQTFCWMNSSIRGSTTKEHAAFRAVEDKRFRAFTQDNANSTNIVMFTRYVDREATDGEWQNKSWFGWGEMGNIWHSRQEQRELQTPAIIQIMHLYNRSMENISITIAHELGHAFGATHTHQLPYSLQPKFRWPCTDEGIGTIMSYCPNRELRFYPNMIKFMHEYTNQMNRHRHDDITVWVFGEQFYRLEGDLDDQPLKGYTDEMTENPCRTVLQVIEGQAAREQDGEEGEELEKNEQEKKEQEKEELEEEEQEGEENKEREQVVVEEEVMDDGNESRDTIDTDLIMGIIIALAVAVGTVMLVSAYKPRGDGSVSINRSSLKDLTKLKYIGDVKASWIIAEREDAKRGGRFKDFEDLIKRVDGITKRLVQVWMKGNVVVTID